MVTTSEMIPTSLDRHYNEIVGFLQRLQNIITCRLVLNLKTFEETRQEASLHLPSLNFATNSFLGNIGAPLRAPGEDYDDFDIDDEPSAAPVDDAAQQDIQPASHGPEETVANTLITEVPV